MFAKLSPSTSTSAAGSGRHKVSPVVICRMVIFLRPIELLIRRQLQHACDVADAAEFPREQRRRGGVTRRQVQKRGELLRHVLHRVGSPVGVGGEVLARGAFARGEERCRIKDANASCGEALFPFVASRSCRLSMR